MAARASFRATVVSAALGGLRLQSYPRRPSLKPFFLSTFPYASVGMRISARGGNGGAGDDAVVKGIAASVSDKSVLEEVRHIMEIARRVSSTRGTHSTDFLAPLTLKAALTAVENLDDVKATAYGGYPQAERCCLSISHPNTMEVVSESVSALRISGNFRFEPCSHGDFLGAILGTGVVRDKIGDILLQGDQGAQVIVVPELVDHLRSSLNKIGNVPVSCAEIPLLALEYEPPRTKSFKAVEASLRVDAVASAGFKISRTKLANLISSGDVLVNSSKVTKNGTILKTGDVVSVSGKGRLKIGEIATTRKGKYAVELIRYL